MTKRTPTVSVTMRRPAAPITDAELLEALSPLLELLNADAEDLETIHISPRSSIRLQIRPRTRRGRRQHDSMVRVTYQVVRTDPDDE